MTTYTMTKAITTTWTDVADLKKWTGSGELQSATADIMATFSVNPGPGIMVSDTVVKRYAADQAAADNWVAFINARSAEKKVTPVSIVVTDETFTFDA